MSFLHSCAKGFVFIALALFSSHLNAQQTNSSKTERIIIERKGDFPEKLVLEVEGGRITLNGKPLAVNDSDIVVQRGDSAGNLVIRIPHWPRLYDFPLPFGDRGQKGGTKIAPNYDRAFGQRAENMRKRSEQIRDEINQMREAMANKAFLGVVSEKAEGGAKIIEVMEGSAADKAGLKPNDIITKVGDKSIDNPETLATTLQQYKPDDEVTIHYRREGESMRTKVKLGKRGLADELRMNVPLQEWRIPDVGKELKIEYLHPWNDSGFKGDLAWFHNRPRLGATIQDTEDDTGVKVLALDEDAPAAKAGVQSGDVITAINGKKVSNVDEAREALRVVEERKVWEIEIMRNGEKQNLRVPIPKPLKKADL